jgi:CRP-like cAMP-binding protein
MMTAQALAASPEISGAKAALASAAPFKDLPAAVLAAVSDAAEVRLYRAGETVFSLGQYDGSDFFFVASGRLKATYAEGAGAMLIEDIRQGAFFGLAETVAFEENARAERVTLAAETDAQTVAIDAVRFRELAAQKPSLTRALLTFFAQAMTRTGVQAAPEETSPERRVFATLLSYVVRDAISGAWRVPRMPKHRELAEKAGVDEASAAAAVAQLIQDGAARRDYPGLVIDDLNRLNRLAS